MPEKRRVLRVVGVYAVLVLALFAAAFTLSGCSGEQQGNASDSSSSSSSSSMSEASVDLSQLDLEYTDRDQDPAYDESEATYVELADGATATGANADAVSADGQTVTISAEGVYVLSGSLSNGQVLVEADDSAKVQLVLSGVEIHNESGPAIRLNAGDKAFVTLADGTQNTLSDGTTYELDEGSDEPYATLFSKIDLTLNGSGSLAVQGNYCHAVCSKDDLVVTGGTYTLTSVGDALRGRDCVKVKDGAFTIEAGEDAVKSNNDEDTTRGYVLIDGGTFNITAGDDAFHAETAFLMRGGEVTVASCYEGYEGQLVQIEGGTTNITAIDDGLNAATGSTDSAAGGAAGDTAPGQADSSCLVEITGGTTHIASTADGIDSNGNVEITGGTVLVDGPTSDGEGAFDYDGSANITGGTVIMVGASGMAQSFTEGTQPFALVQASGSAGDSVAIADSQGNVIASFVAQTRFECVVVSAADLQDGQEYQLVVGGTVSGGSSDGDLVVGGTVSGGSSTSFTASTQGSSGAMDASGGLSEPGDMGGSDGMNEPGGDVQGPQSQPGGQGQAMQPGGQAVSSKDVLDSNAARTLTTS